MAERLPMSVASQEPTGALLSLLQASADGVLVVDGTGRIRYANPAAATLLRRAPEQLLGSEFGYVSASDRPVELIVAAESADAAVVEMRVAPCRWGDIPAVMLNLRDITAHKRQEEEVRRANVLLQALRYVDELLRQPGAARDVAGEICRYLVEHEVQTYAAIRMRGRGLEGDWLVEALPAAGGGVRVEQSECDPTRTCRLHLPQRPGEVAVRSAGEACDRCHGSRLDPEPLRLSARIDANDRDIGLLTTVPCGRAPVALNELQFLQTLAADVGRAVHARDQARQLHHSKAETKRTEDRFARLVQHSTDAIMIADEAGRYLHVNQAACDLLGYTRAELLAMGVTDLTASDGTDLGAAFEAFREVGEASGTLSFVRQDGEVRTADYSAFRLSPHEYVSILRDVTGRIALEHQVRHAERLDSIGRLAGGVAHDFNNILTGISGFAELVARELPPESQARADVDEILRATRRAAALTNQLLAFSRRQAVQPECIALNARVEEVQAMLRRLISEHIDLVLRLGHGVDCVCIDPTAFEQVLVNLVVNARDALRGQGTITIATRALTLADPFVGVGSETVPAGEYVLLEVSDDGVGMDTATQAKLFEPFFTTKESGKGTGLGLATTFGIVAQAGGAITVESTPGRGTTFRIYLPRVRGAPRRPSSEQHLRPRGGAGTVLLVEDDAGIRKLAGRALQGAGHTVLTAPDPEAAIELVRGHAGRIDLLLTDVVMPRMSGPALARHLRDAHPDLPVIFMSGYAGDMHEQDEALASADRFVEKPFAIEDLLQAVSDVLATPSGGAR